MTLATSPPQLSPGPRRPPPQSRLDVAGLLGATAFAAVAYVVGATLDFLPSPGFAVVLFGAAPLLAGLALVLLLRERDPALRWVATGVGVAVVAMVLQLISFPAVAAGGGVLQTSSYGSSELYLLFHLFPALCAVAGALGADPRWRRPVAVAGVLLALLVATNRVRLPLLIRRDGSFTAPLVAAEAGSAAVLALCAGVWVWRIGRSTEPVRGWVGVALSLMAYDVGLNAIGGKRFDPIWWSSLSMRVATWAALGGGALVALVRSTRALERYTEDELDRREGELRESLRATERLLTVAADLGRALTVEQVGAVLVHAAATIEDVDAVLLGVLDEDGGPTLRLLDSVGFDEETVRVVERRPLQKPLPEAAVLLTRRAQFFASHEALGAAFPDAAGLPPYDRAGSLAVVPLTVTDTDLGALSVVGRAAHDWSRLDRELLTALSAQGAQAMQRARLYERERRTAETLQNSLLPQLLPRQPGIEVAARYLPGSLGLVVGGDWYDVIAVDEYRLGLVVGDVMGKGLRAASLMGQVRNALRAFATIDASPAGVLHHLDRLTRDMDEDEIVTLVYALLDRRDGSLHVARAGHLPPLHIRADGTATLVEGGESPPMGVPADTRPETVIALDPGDMVLLYSDGLVEDRRTGLDVGLPLLVQEASRLFAAAEVTAQTVVTGLLAATDAVAGRSDDVTMLGVRRSAAADG